MAGMKYDSNKHHRRSIRLNGYDYNQAGMYFVTFVTQNRMCLFGEIADGETRLNEAGSVIERWWFEMNNKFRTVKTDEFVIMPNHFHGIVVIVGADRCVGPVGKGAHIGAPLQETQPVRPVALSAIVQWFKTMTTNEYLRGVKTSGWTPFPGRLWQRNYYEHVIRDEESLSHIRQYILNNPVRWEFDRENPAAKTSDLENACSG